MLRAEAIATPRLLLQPLQASDADELFEVQNDDRLYHFTGGAPLALPRLRERYAALSSQVSPDGRASWLNWVVRLREEGRAAGMVQAAVASDAARIAWIVGVPWQRRGFASEAALALVGWLESREVSTITATIHPDHEASQRVAARAGLAPTADVVDGEVVWRKGPAGSA
jgi:RimJ/RimL family protein N-acetyltransferase